MMRLRIHSLKWHQAGVLELAGVISASLHSTPVQGKATVGSDLAQEISDNILAAGIRYLKGDKEKLAENLKRRNAGVDLENMLKTQEKIRLCIREINNCQRDRNVLTKGIATAKEERESVAANGSDAVPVELGGEGGVNDGDRKSSINVKQYLKTLQYKLEEMKHELVSQVVDIPNFTHPDVPEGDYSASRVVHTHGSKPEFSFPVLDHLDLGEKHELIDFSTPAMVSKRNFYYLKGAAALLELALIQFAMQKALSKGYYPIMTPDVVKTAVVSGCGFNPRSRNDQVYRLLGYQDRLCLTGTAEIPMAGMILGQLMALKKMPFRYVAFGRCFRPESGGYGQGPRGLYRVHQFSKVELFSVTANETGEESEEMLREIVGIQREIAEELGLHYRVLEMSTEELGNPAYHKYDLEVWMPGRGDYGEVCSASNCTDYQSMRLKAVYDNPAFNKDRNQPKKKFVHTVNGTACAVPRMILALLENYQQEDGSVLLPKALHPYLPPDCWHIGAQKETAEQTQ